MDQAKSLERSQAEEDDLAQAIADVESEEAWDDQLEQRVANAEQALRESEQRYEAELTKTRDSLRLYLGIWLHRCGGGPIHITQDELHEAAEEAKSGTPLAFEVQEDGETLRISVGTVRD